MEIEVSARAGNKKKLVSALLPSMVQQLGLGSSRAGLLVMIHGDMEDPGLAVLLMPNMYCISLNSRLSLGELAVSLAHEMVHVAQMIRGTLKSGPDGGSWWSGKFYPESTPYLDKPWEIKAFQRQELIARRALESL